MKRRMNRSGRRRAHAWLIVAAWGLVTMCFVLSSCDRTRHHETMTFFFDGVPPLSSESSGLGPFEPNAGDVMTGASAGGWYVHEPIPNCADCHGAGQRTSFSRQANLVAEVPVLCYNCHEDYARLEGWVHGPVAMGDCLLCHEHHKSRNEYLLKRPAPDLCYQCHLPEAVGAIEGHAEASYAHCIDCHDGHASTSRSLLNLAYLNQPAGAVYLSEARQRLYEQALQAAASDLARNHDVPALLAAAVERARTGQWDQVRAYLDVIVNSGLLSASEQTEMAELLQRVSSWQEAERAGRADEPVEQRLIAALRQVRERRSARDQSLAELYYRSIQLYHAGRYGEAAEGFRTVLDSAAALGPVKETARRYWEQIGRQGDVQ